MRTTLATLCMLGLVFGCERRADREAEAAADRPAADSLTMTSSTVADTTGGDTLDWRPAPPGLPAGARGAVLAGDPSKPGPYTLRMEMPEGYRVPPHHHPKAEHVKVLEGTVMLGRGKQWADEKLEALPAGAEVTMEAEHPHYVQAKTRTLLEMHGTGPFTITYENPADDPRKAPIQ